MKILQNVHDIDDYFLLELADINASIGAHDAVVQIAEKLVVKLHQRLLFELTFLKYPGECQERRNRLFWAAYSKKWGIPCWACVCSPEQRANRVAFSLVCCNRRVRSHSSF
jgi:hypothetical protein